MIEFDKKISEWAVDKNFYYRRYSDDILLICHLSTSRKELSKVIDNELRELGLKLNSSKTTECYFVNGQLTKGSQPLQYLGFSFDGRKILVRSASFSRYLKKLKKRIRLLEGSANRLGTSKINLQKLHKRYSHLGKRNFISYCLRASAIMKSDSLRRQASRHWKVIHAWIKEATLRLQEIQKHKSSPKPPTLTYPSKSSASVRVK